MRIAIILGSVREGRKSDRVLKFILKSVGEKQGLIVDPLDLKDFPFSIMQERLVKLDSPEPALVRFSNVLKESDGILIISPEYNGSYPGALKNALDYFKSEYFKKPFGLITTSAGQWGGVNAAHHLESWVLHVKGFPSPFKLNIPFVDQVIDPDGLLLDPKFDSRTETFLQEFFWLTEAITKHMQIS